jgi:hypothetical protein
MLHICRFDNTLLLYFAAQRKGIKAEGRHSPFFHQELCDDIDHEHAEETERLDAGHVVGNQVRGFFIKSLLLWSIFLNPIKDNTY